MIRMPTADDPVEIVQGDCLSVMRELPDGCVVVTDAPYGLNYDASKSTQFGITAFDMIYGDDGPFDVSPFLRFSDVLVWCRPQLTLGVPIGCGAWYAWDKVTRNGQNVRISECEYAWHKRATKTRAFRHLWSGAYRDSESGRPAIHPNQKPVALMRWCLELVSRPGDLIIDPFGGSGATALACVLTGRRCILIEIDPGYCAIAKRRVDEALCRQPGSLFATVTEPASLFSDPTD